MHFLARFPRSTSALILVLMGALLVGCAPQEEEIPPLDMEAILASTTDFQADLRAWATNNSITMPANGDIPISVINAYDASTRWTTP